MPVAGAATAGLGLVLIGKKEGSECSVGGLTWVRVRSQCWQGLTGLGHEQRLAKPSHSVEQKKLLEASVRTFGILLEPCALFIQMR